MSLGELKEQLHQLIEAAPEANLREMRDVLTRKLQPEGEFIPEIGATFSEYNRELEEGDAAIRQGEYYTQEEATVYLNKRMAKYWDGGKME